MKKCRAALFLVMAFVMIFNNIVCAKSLEFAEEDYKQIIEKINEEYDVNVQYFDEYKEAQISPQELYDYITGKLNNKEQEYAIDIHKIREVGEAAKAVEQYPIVATVTYRYSYNNSNGRELFTSCKNVTSKTSTAAAICKVVFVQNSYEANVIDLGRTLKIKIYGKYTDYSGILPVSINNYNVSFELYYNNI